MRKVILSLILVVVFGAVGFAGERVSPYLDGVNIMHKGRGAGYMVQGSGNKVQGSGHRVHGTGPLGIFRVVRFPGGLLADKYHWMKDGVDV